jgi:hypothetical protein
MSMSTKTIDLTGFTHDIQCIYIYEMGSFVFFLVYSRPEQRQLLAQSDSSGHAREDKIIVAYSPACCYRSVHFYVRRQLYLRIYSRIVKSV